MLPPPFTSAPRSLHANPSVESELEVEEQDAEMEDVDDSQEPSTVRVLPTDEEDKMDLGASEEGEPDLDEEPEDEEIEEEIEEEDEDGDEVQDTMAVEDEELKRDAKGLEAGHSSADEDV